MIQAIIFDCFGVLTTDAWLPFKAQHFGHDPELLAQASELNRQSDGGYITTESFLEQIGVMANMSSNGVYRAVSNNVPNTELFGYIKQLKVDYRIGMLSNASDDWLSELFEPDQLQLFEVTALSYETGFTKPMPEAYTTIAERLAIPVEQCVFIDDQERFVTGAREAGMQAIWYKNNAQLNTELTQLLADSKD
jgi:HAD superfamily hydrolase (TIGR01509 family)